jgi:hypothetical protein
LILLMSGFCQNVLLLKNGDKINGKLDGFKNDTIIFKFQGNKLKFRTTEIVSIIFDESFSSQITIKEPNIIANKKKDGKISGVVTFFFNKNYGDKPDIGSKVFIADSLETTQINLSTLDSFQHGSFYRNILQEYKRLGLKTPADVLAELKKWNVEENVQFDSLDSRTYKIIINIMKANGVREIVVDGSGNYNVNIKPGTYYVYIQSNNRNALSRTEIMGKMHCQKVTIIDGDEINVSTNFGLH